MAKPSKDIVAEALAKAEAIKKRVKQQQAAAKAPQYFEMPEVTGEAQADAAADLDAVQAGFRKRAKDEGRRFELATDTEYWTCLCFQSRDQKEAFLRALKLLDLGDKYLDGQEVAQRLGVSLPAADVPYNTGDRIDKKWLEFIDD